MLPGCQGAGAAAGVRASDGVKGVKLRNTLQ